MSQDTKNIIGISASFIAEIIFGLLSFITIIYIKPKSSLYSLYLVVDFIFLICSIIYGQWHLMVYKLNAKKRYQKNLCFFLIGLQGLLAVIILVIDISL